MTEANGDLVDIDELVQSIRTSRVYEVCDETPLQLAPKLSTRLGYSVHLKREDLQELLSFRRSPGQRCPLADPRRRP